jgi:hypothetical protein
MSKNSSCKTPDRRSESAFRCRGRAARTGRRFRRLYLDHSGGHGCVEVGEQIALAFALVRGKEKCAVRPYRATE